MAEKLFGLGDLWSPLTTSERSDIVAERSSLGQLIDPNLSTIQDFTQEMGEPLIQEITHSIYRNKNKIIRYFKEKSLLYKTILPTAPQLTAEAILENISLPMESISNQFNKDNSQIGFIFWYDFSYGLENVLHGILLGSEQAKLKTAKSPESFRRRTRLGLLEDAANKTTLLNERKLARSSLLQDPTGDQLLQISLETILASLDGLAEGDILPTIMSYHIGPFIAKGAKAGAKIYKQLYPLAVQALSKDPI